MCVPIEEILDRESYARVAAENIQNQGLSEFIRV